MRSGPKSVSPEKTPLSFCCAGPTPVKSGFVVAGPSFEDGFNLPGAVDLSVRVVRDAQDNQEEPVMGDTPPGPGSAGFFCLICTRRSLVTVSWPFLLLMARGAALISTVISC